MAYNKETKMIDDKVEVLEKGTAERIINNVIWGDSEYNPNK